MMVSTFRFFSSSSFIEPWLSANNCQKNVHSRSSLFFSACLKVLPTLLNTYLNTLINVYLPECIYAFLPAFIHAWMPACLNTCQPNRTQKHFNSSTLSISWVGTHLNFDKHIVKLSYTRFSYYTVKSILLDLILLCL